MNIRRIALPLAAFAALVAAAPVAAGPPAPGSTLLGFEGGERTDGSLAPLSAELKVARDGRSFRARGSYVTMRLDCRRTRSVRVAVRGGSGRPLAIGRAGRFALADSRGELSFRLRGRFVTPGYARLTYVASVAPRRPGARRCSSGRSSVALYRNGRPPFSGCRSQRARTLGASDEGRVFEQYRFERSAFFPHVYACGFEADVRVPLGRNYDEETIEPVRVAGAFVAYASHGCGVGGCTPALELRRLGDGATVASVDATPGAPDGPGLVHDLEPKENGSLAWLVGRSEWFVAGSATFQVWARDAAGERLLDDSPEIDRTSLALRGSTLTWMKAGAQRSATLD